MNTYFAILKKGVRFSSVKKKLSDEGIEIRKHYPKLKVVKFESIKELKDFDFEFFESVEKEKENFTIG